jgi:hypothetical protein
MKCSIKNCKKKAQGEIVINKKTYPMCFKHFYETWTNEKLEKEVKK